MRAPAAYRPLPAPATRRGQQRPPKHPLAKSLGAWASTEYRLAVVQLYDDICPPPARLLFMKQSQVPLLRRMQVCTAMALPQTLRTVTSRLVALPQLRPRTADTTCTHEL